jgi:hypothetical protein
MEMNVQAHWGKRILDNGMISYTSIVGQVFGNCSEGVSTESSTARIARGDPAGEQDLT